MAELVSVVALSHAPGLTGWLDQAPEDQQESLTAGFSRLGDILRATRPDVIIGLANDHLLNMPPHDTHDFCVGTSGSWSGPAEWFRDWVNVPPYTVAGDRGVAGAVFDGLSARGFDTVSTDHLLFDDNWSVPLFYLTPDHDIPLVPIHMNCISPPVPTPEISVRAGEVIARTIRDDLPDGMRVAVMGTGGLSHEPGGPRYFTLDEDFDRWFMALLEEGDLGKVCREATVEKMNAAGGGGTTELLAWMVAMAAAGGTRARSIFYVPSAEMRCGIGGTVWDTIH